MKKLVIGLSVSMLLAISSAMAAEHVIGQKDKAFVISGSSVEELDIAVGDTIKFVNQDPYFHNIFSLSDLTTFDLGSFPEGDSRTVTFDEAGSVEIECAIHPEMYIEVTVK